jgi:hypothetical protein
VFDGRHGLRSVEGGHHPGWGTANRIVPLGDSYLELVAVVDEREAATSRFGSWIAASASPTGRIVGWAVRPDDLDATAARHGLRIDAGSRTTPAGERVTWRLAGTDEATSRGWLPFFIEWGDLATFPGTSAAPAAAIRHVEIEGDERELSDWLGDHSLPLVTRAGTRGVTRIVLEGTAGQVVIEEAET